MDTSRPLLDRADVEIRHLLSDRGATGKVYACAEADFVYKEYDPRYCEPVAGSHVGALVRWRRALGTQEVRFVDESCAWPITEVRRDDQSVGFLMRRPPESFSTTVRGKPVLVELQRFNVDDPDFGMVKATQDEKYSLMISYIEVIEFLYKRGLVFYDISGTNLLWRQKAGSLDTFLLDCDSVVIVGKSKPNTPVLGTQGKIDLRPGAPVDLETASSTIGFLYYFYCLGVKTQPLAGMDLLPHLPADRPRMLDDLLLASLGTTTPRPTPSDWLQQVTALQHSDGAFGSDLTYYAASVLVFLSTMATASGLAYLFGL